MSKISKKKLSVVQLIVLIILGIVVSPLIVVLLVFIVLLAPFIVIYLCYSKLTTLRLEKHEMNLKLEHKLATDKNLLELKYRVEQLNRYKNV